MEVLMYITCATFAGTHNVYHTHIITKLLLVASCPNNIMCTSYTYTQYLVYTILHFIHTTGHLVSIPEPLTQCTRTVRTVYTRTIRTVYTRTIRTVYTRTIRTVYIRTIRTVYTRTIWSVFGHMLWFTAMHL